MDSVTHSVSDTIGRSETFLTITDAKKKSLLYTLDCKRDGYVNMRHNTLRDKIAKLNRHLCTDV